jgi:aspartate/methionine/tyrosine aminotransferase
VINGVAKTYAMTGWRVGWMIGPAEVVRAAINLQSQSTSNVANVSQRAALAAVSGDLSAMSAMRQVFDRRRRLLHRGLNDIPGISCIEPEGAFYAFPSVAGVLGRSIRGHRPGSSMELAAVMLDEAQVAVVPGEAFGCTGYARLSYALADDQLTEGVRRLAELLGEAA